MIVLNEKEPVQAVAETQNRIKIIETEREVADFFFFIIINRLDIIVLTL
jgi:hypothetical protein